MKSPIAPFDKLLSINGTPAERILDLVHVLETMVSKALNSGSSDEQLIERNGLLVEEVHQLRQVNIGHRREIGRLNQQHEDFGEKADVAGYQVVGISGAIFKMRLSRQQAVEDAKGFPEAKIRVLYGGTPEDVEAPSEDWLPPAIRDYLSAK